MSQENLRLYRLSPLLLDLQNYFLQIKTIADTDCVTVNDKQDIQLLSKHALMMLDYTLFTMDALQTELSFTSVSTAAAVTDVAESLRLLAKKYDVDLALDITNTLEPVYANEKALKGAVYGLASSLITINKPTGQKIKIVIAAQETSPQWQRVGIYSPDVDILPATIKKASKLAGQARSLAPKSLHTSGLGLVLTDQLSNVLGSSIQRFTHRGYRGVGFYVPLSGQLQFL